MSTSEVTFMIVDDDDLDVELIQRAFQKLRILNPVVRARDGIEALDILRGTGGQEKIAWPFIILLDINMPRMSGLEMLNELRDDEALKRSIIFMLTTSDDEHDISSSYAKHVAGYVVKSRVGTSFEEALEMLDHYWKIVELPV